MPYKIASLDVHKVNLAAVNSDVEVVGEFEFERRQFGTTDGGLHQLVHWLIEQQVDEVVMESTAQYWKPVWAALERYWKPVVQKREGARPTTGSLHLAQAQSNRARRGRKRDFTDAERLLKRLVANELVLSLVPDPEQRLWRTIAPCQEAADRQSSPVAESAGGIAGRSVHQVVLLRFGSARAQCPAYVEGARRRGDRPRSRSGPCRQSLASHAQPVE